MPGPLMAPIGTRFSTGQDTIFLSGPSTAPSGAVLVTAGGTGLDDATSSNPAGTTFYLLAGAHVLGAGSPTAFSQIIPKAGNTYIGAPGAVLDGRGINRYAFTGSAANVTLKYLNITGFVSFLDEFVVNHDAATGWLISHCNIHDNTGAGVGVGSFAVVEYSWLHNNSQYGFSSYKPAMGSGAVSAITNVVIDHCEIAYNGTRSDEYNPDGTPTYRGRNGGGKFWDTNGITVTHNWIHHSYYVGIWADTNNIATRLDSNLIEDNDSEGFFYEISYNFLITGNTFRRNAIYKGKNWATRSDDFPIAAVYISESGGDSAVSATYGASSMDNNTFINNWGDLTLWENADRFCNSPSNTSNKVYKPLGHGASLAICNQPTGKTLTGNTTAGSAILTVTAGVFEMTDEGRPLSGPGIPTGTNILAPSFAGDTSGYISTTQCRMSANATATASGVTVVVAAGSISTDPAYTACRWHTQNILIQNNTFSHDPATVLGATTLPAGVRTGKIAVLSNYGSYPSWSPYTGTVIQDAVTLHQNNVWANNTYGGPYSWMPRDNSGNLTFSQWQAAPYSQDAGSTFTVTPLGAPMAQSTVIDLPNVYLPAPSGDSTGLTDATTINAALTAVSAAGGGRVVAKSGVVYQVSTTGTQTVANPSGSTPLAQRAIVIPNSVILDMNGSTLQLRGTTDCWIACNNNTSGTGTRSHDVGLHNAVIDANGIVTSSLANVHFSHIDRLSLRNIKLINGQYFGVWCYNVKDSVFNDLDVDTFTGNPWQFGDPQAGGDGLNKVYNSTFGNLRAKNVALLNTGSQPGNPYTFCMTKCTVDSIWAYNCGGGVKVYGAGNDNAFGSVILDTIGEATALNSGFKLQGDNTWGTINRITVGQVVASNQANFGLGLLFTQDCTVGSYTGFNNVLLHTANSDVLVGGGINDHVNSINSISSNGGGVRVSTAPGVTGNPSGYRIDNIRVTNCGINPSGAIREAVRVDVTSDGSFGTITAVDNQTTHTMSRGFNATAGTGVIDRFTAAGYTDVAFASTGGGFVQPGSANSYYVQGDLSEGDSRAQGYLTWTYDPIFGVVAGLGTGMQYLTKLWIPRTITVSNITTYVNTAGAGLTTVGTNMALYGSSGTRIAATAELSTQFQTNGPKTITIGTPISITGGAGVYVWGAVKASGTTLPQLLRPISTVSGAINVGLTASTYRAAILNPASTTALLPASFTPSTDLVTSANYLFFALS